MTEEALLELPGLVCPMPVLKTKKRLQTLAPGALLRVVSTDPMSLPDLAEFCRQTGHELVGQEARPEAGRFVTLIRRKAL